MENNMRDNIMNLIKSGVTAHTVAVDTGLPRNTVYRIFNGEAKMDNITLKNAEVLSDYYLKERKEMNIESLDQAIADFNDWDGAARIYIDKDDGYFETSVYANDLQMSESLSTENYAPVYDKSEFDNKKIAERRKEYIVRFSRLILDGWETTEAKEKLVDDFGLFD